MEENTRWSKISGVKQLFCCIIRSCHYPRNQTCGVAGRWEETYWDHKRTWVVISTIQRFQVYPPRGAWFECRHLTAWALLGKVSKNKNGGGRCVCISWKREAAKSQVVAHSQSPKLQFSVPVLQRRTIMNNYSFHRSQWSDIVFLTSSVRYQWHFIKSI